MRKFTLLLSTLIMVSMVLVACGGEETSTAAPSTSLPTMEEPTSAATSTEAAPAGTGTAGTGTPGVPVTGEDNPSRLSNQLDFNVWNQDGEQIGEVDDMVLDLGDAAVSYVVVGTGGFLDIGEKEVLVPWDSLELQTEGGDMTGGEQNAFILQTDQETFNNAPDVDMNSILPPLGQAVDDWDLEIRNYWEGGSVAPAGTPSTGTSSTGTPSTGTTETAMPEVTGTASSGLATAMPEGAGMTTGTLQGVVLATDVLGSNITVGMNGAIVTSPGQVQGTGTPAASTAMPATTETPSTSTSSTPSTTTNATPSTSLGTNNLGELVNATIEDVIVDPATGDIQYIVISSSMDNNEHWIPVPLDLLRWDASTDAFALDTDQAMLQGAPFFTADEFPDTTLDGWDTDFSSYWSGAGTGTNPTATP